MLFKTSLAILAAAFVAIFAQVSFAQTQSADELAAVLESDASLHDKAVACKKLAVTGTAEVVPTLAKLLSDEQLSHYARFGLEPIPDPSVDEAFRAALKSLEGPLLIGVINSIGQRRDAKAVEPLQRLLNDADAEVSAAAAGALGRIGNEKCAQILLETLQDTETAERSPVADACLACAEQLLADNDQEQAVKIYDTVRQAELPTHLRAAATYAAILATKSTPLLLEQLEVENESVFQVALQASRRIADPKVTEGLIASFDELPSHRQVPVIAALADRGDAAALPTVVKAAQSGSAAVRIAAIRALRELGDASVVPLLVTAAAEDNERIAQAAFDTLAVLPGAEVDQAIVDRLTEAEGSSQTALIKLAGQRRIKSSLPELLVAADSAREDARLAAIGALGEVIEINDLQELTKRVSSARTPEEKSAAIEALTAACVRMEDREDCVRKVAAQFDNAPPEEKAILFELLREVGGPAALATVSAGAKDSDDAVQDAATRVLGEWLTVDVAPELLDLAKTLDSEKYKIRALRGYIRIIRQFGLPVEERVAMTRKAMAAASRLEEQKLALQALPRFPAPQSLSLATSFLDTRLKADAARSAVAIAEQIAPEAPEAVRDAMRQVTQAGVGKALEQRAKSVLDQVE